MRSVSDKSCRVNQNTHFILNNIFLRKSCRLRDNVENIVQPGRSQMTIWCMCIAWWMHMVTVTHSEHAVIIAFPWQQWLHECGSVCVIRALPVLFKFI